MNNRERQDLLDHQADKDLERMFDKVAELEGQALWEAYQAELEAGTLPEVPKELSKACSDRIFVPKKGHSKVWPLKKHGICFKNVAIIALVFIFCASYLVMNVEAIRLPVLNFLVDKDNRYSMVYFSSKRPGEKDLSLISKIQSVALPDGYFLTDQWQLEDGSCGFFLENDDSQYVQVSFVSSSSLFNYDIEDAEQAQTKILEYDAILIKKHGLRVIWMDDKNTGVFDIRSNGLSEKDFWKYVLHIAESTN